MRIACNAVHTKILAISVCFHGPFCILKVKHGIRGFEDLNVCTDGQTVIFQIPKNTKRH